MVVDKLGVYNFNDMLELSMSMFCYGETCQSGFLSLIGYQYKLAWV